MGVAQLLLVDNNFLQKTSDQCPKMRTLDTSCLRRDKSILVAEKQGLQKTKTILRKQRYTRPIYDGCAHTQQSGKEKASQTSSFGYSDLGLRGYDLLRARREPY